MSVSYRVAVFARNEERGIGATLRSVLAACGTGADLRIHVLVNGCTDRTLSVVQAWAHDHEAIVPVELPFGDKCHAWNTYVYEWADEAPVHFFMDGDVTCSEGALALMQAALLDTPATAMAGVPLSGRNRARYAEYIRRWHWLFGNLYAIRGDHLQRVRAAGVRLPVGLSAADDHFVSKIGAARTFDQPDYDWSQNIHRDGVGYRFPSLKPYRWSDGRLYIRRRVAYALRQMQIREIDHLPLAQLPKTVDTVNRRILARLEAGPPGPNPITWAVRRRLRRLYPHAESTWFEDRLRAANGPPARHGD